MTQRELEETVTALVREVLPKRNKKIPLTAELRLQSDLGIDSFGLMTLAFRIEERFGVDLQANAAKVAKLKTIGELCALLDGLRAGVQPNA